MKSSHIFLAAITLLPLGCTKSSQPQQLSNQNNPTPTLTQAKNVGKLENVADFYGPMPTGVTVSQTGRIFINYPRWGDKVPFTVAELKDGQPVAFPDEQINKVNPDDPSKCLVSVQSVVVDPADRLWILDTGSISMSPAIPNGPKLVAVDLKTNKVIKSISFPSDVALPTTYLNDVRFDLRKSTEGIAYITDSSSDGPNGIIVVDLATGHSWRKLNDHPSTKAEKDYVPVVEGQPLLQRSPGQDPKPMKMGSDGIAISADGARLFYCPLIGTHLYSVSTQALIEEHASADQVAATVKDEGRKAPSDGLESDAQGNIYATDYIHQAVHRKTPEGQWQTIIQDPRLLWPDTMSITNGYLYVTANQLNRQPTYHWGKDLRQQPYHLFRIQLDAQPVELKK